jgi:hypothetical protein
VDDQVGDPPAPKILGLLAEDPAAYARAHDAVLVDFVAPRSDRMSAREWLETTAAIEGCTPREATAITDTLLGQIGAPQGKSAGMGALSPMHRAGIALAEAAVVAWAHHVSLVVVPSPPVPWPARNDVRRLALAMLAGIDVALHAREAWELLPLVPHHALIDARGEPVAKKHDGRAFVTRVYGSGDPYAAWRTALEARGVAIEGGPISHVLRVPEGVGAREILADAFETGVDVLEVRGLFEAR